MVITATLRVCAAKTVTRWGLAKPSSQCERLRGASRRMIRAAIKQQSISMQYRYDMGSPESP